HMQIELEDLLLDEAGKAHEEFLKVRFDKMSGQDTGQFYTNCIADCIAITETMLNMAIALCWYGNGEKAEVLSTAMSRWTTAKDYEQETNPLMRIPPLLLMYVGGIAALQRSHWTYLRALTFDPTFYSIRGNKRLPVLDWVTKSSIFRYNDKHMWFDIDPLSQIIRRTLRPIFARHLPMEMEYQDLFDLFEMVLAVLLVSTDKQNWIGHDAAMPRYAEFGQWDFIRRFWISGARQGRNWGFLRTFFDGDSKKLEETLAAYQVTLQKLNSGKTTPNYSEEYMNSFRG
ncbi:MAG: hypothetical protein JNM70_21270, partial [Anaerolineae bacterium]|nr:hypothetical protein [Anaerolineae bacterium]